MLMHVDLYLTPLMVAQAIAGSLLITVFFLSLYGLVERKTMTVKKCIECQTKPIEKITSSGKIELYCPDCNRYIKAAQKNEVVAKWNKIN